MSAAGIEITLDLPWPHCWTQLQWEVAAWLARHGDRARVEVVWNETRLAGQVAAPAFQEATAATWHVLRDRLGEGCRWQVARADASACHRLVLGVSGRQA